MTVQSEIDRFPAHVFRAWEAMLRRAARRDGFKLEKVHGTYTLRSMRLLTIRSGLFCDPYVHPDDLDELIGWLSAVRDELRRGHDGGLRERNCAANGCDPGCTTHCQA
jgi:hypothetical protein